MNVSAWHGQITAPVAVAIGILACFWGYRLLKVLLGIIGFVAGASAGWALASSMAPGNNVVALVCAAVLGLIGAALCVWLFFVGIFLLGATAGAVFAAALFSSTGSQPSPIVVIALALICGIIALVMQKFMIIIATAFNGSYLITAGVFKLLTGARNPYPLWLNASHAGSAGAWDYAALALWIVLGLVGMSVQYRSSRREVVVQKQPAQ